MTRPAAIRVGNPGERRPGRVLRRFSCGLFGAALVSACQHDATTDPSVADNRPCQLTVAGDRLVRNIYQHLYVDARIDNKPVVLLFDTGADTTVLTPTAAARLDLFRMDKNAGEFEGIGGHRPAQRYEASDFNLGELHGASWRFLVADLLSKMPSGADGLIGGDFLQRYDIDFDLPGGKIIIYYPEHDCSHPSVFMHGDLYQAGLLQFDYHALDRLAPGYARAAPYWRATPTIEINVMIDNQVLKASLDTGAPENILFLSGARKLRMTPARLNHDKRTFAYGVGPNAVRAVSHIFGAVDLGPLQLANLPVKIIDQDTSDGPDMLLGLDLFRRVHIWVSRSSGILIMQFPPLPSPSLAGGDQG